MKSFYREFSGREWEELQEHGGWGLWSPKLLLDMWFMKADLCPMCTREICDYFIDVLKVNKKELYDYMDARLPHKSEQYVGLPNGERYTQVVDNCTRLEILPYLIKRMEDK